MVFMNKYVCVCVFESSKLTMCLVYRGGKKLKMCRQLDSSTCECKELLWIHLASLYPTVVELYI